MAKTRTGTFLKKWTLLLLLEDKNKMIQAQNNRFIFIDSLRGIAALAVAGCHFYTTTPIGKEVISKSIPTELDYFIKNLSSGVEVFFVISGFVIAYTLRNTTINFQSASNFFIRRILRLAPPYWLALILSMLIAGVSNIFIRDRIASLPSFNAILANFLYLQDILQLGQIIGAAWTLCLEVQFYLLFIILMAVYQWLRCNFETNNQYALVVFLPLLLVSCCSRIGIINIPIPGLCISYWYMFFYGVILCWIMEHKIRDVWFILFSLLIIGILQITSQLADESHQAADLVLVLTGLLIFASIKLKKLGLWLNSNILLYFGQISYSLYLIHGDIGSRFLNIMYRFGKQNLLNAYVSMFLAFLITIFVAHIMYILVEKPSINLVKKLKVI